MAVKWLWYRFDTDFDSPTCSVEFAHTPKMVHQWKAKVNQPSTKSGWQANDARD
ncbi:hypothetical protein RDWZM_004442, partial [Blomia tropicalis]